MFTVMLFLFFFFIGIAGMLLYYNRYMARQLRELSEEHAQLRVLLRALEARLDGIAALEKINSEKKTQTRDDVERDIPPGQDPLLHLSFDKTRDLPAPPALEDETPLKM